MRDIGDDEQRSVRPQLPVAQRVAAARGRLLCCDSLEMSRIACVAASHIRSRDPRHFHHGLLACPGQPCDILLMHTQS